MNAEEGVSLKLKQGGGNLTPQAATPHKQLLAGKESSLASSYQVSSVVTSVGSQEESTATCFFSFSFSFSFLFSSTDDEFASFESEAVLTFQAPVGHHIAQHVRPAVLLNIRKQPPPHVDIHPELLIPPRRQSH
jgi:hypothetical protein